MLLKMHTAVEELAVRHVTTDGAACMHDVCIYFAII